jgi:tRNA uridine 5-carbamoylmethylation protein Kti12
MLTVYLTCGLPGSGKSTWSIKKAESDASVVILSKDAFRNMIKGTYVFDTLYEPMINALTESCIYHILDSRFNLIIDETNLTPMMRTKWLRVINDTEIEVRKICVWLTETQVNLENRMKDARGYDAEKWTEVIDRMRARFTPPTLDEGFDEIIQMPIGGF